METRERSRAALRAAVVAVVLWQLTTEVRALMIRASIDPPLRQFWPPGSPFTVQTIARDRMLDLVGLLVALGVLLAGVYLLVRAATGRGRASRGTVFMASWMGVVLAVGVAGLVGQVLLLVLQQFPSSFFLEQLGYATRVPYWGVVVGWVAALVAARSVPAHDGGNPAVSVGYAVDPAGSPGYPAPGGATGYYPSASASDPSESPYVDRGRREG